MRSYLGAREGEEENSETREKQAEKWGKAEWHGEEEKREQQILITIYGAKWMPGGDTDNARKLN